MRAQRSGSLTGRIPGASGRDRTISGCGHGECGTHTHTRTRLSGMWGAAWDGAWCRGGKHTQPCGSELSLAVAMRHATPHAYLVRRFVSRLAVMSDMAGVIPMPLATRIILLKLKAAEYGEANGPLTHAGSDVGRSMAAWSFAVQSPEVFMHRQEWLDNVGCANSEKACHSFLASHGKLMRR